MELALEQVSRILSPGGDTTFKFSDDGVAEIVVDSGLAEYRYLSQHKVSKWLTFQDPKLFIMVSSTKACLGKHSKNCSSFIQKVLDDNNWTIVPPEYAENYIDLVDGILSSKSVEKIVILRDPVQRWISGFAETFGIQEYRDSDVKIDPNDLYDPIIQ